MTNEEREERTSNYIQLQKEIFDMNLVWKELGPDGFLRFEQPAQLLYRTINKKTNEITDKSFIDIHIETFTDLKLLFTKKEIREMICTKLGLNDE